MYVGHDDGFTTTGTKKGGKPLKKKEHKETPIPVPVAEAKGKKKKQATFMYGNMATGADQEETKIQEQKNTEVHEEQHEEQEHKGKKHHQKEKGGKKQQKKGKNKKDSEEEEEKVKDLEPEGDKEEVKEEIETAQTTKKNGLPIEVVYCAICDLPPEYCMVDKKDSTECKNWLKDTHPQLYQQIYPEVEGGEGEEEKKEETKAAPQKKKKKVGFGVVEAGQIKIYKSKRGKKKTICSIVGLQNYGVNLKDMAKLMSKKFASSAAVTNEDKYGECIQIQGDIQERFEEFIESELAKYKITSDKVKFEEVKKKKAETTEGDQ